MSQIPYVFLNCLRCERDENESGEENVSRFWPMVPCDAKKCEKMCLDFYGPPVSAYCDKPGSSNANCACLSQTVRSFDRCISLCIFLPRNK